MWILTTLLALLLASPAFAETWVCSNRGDDGEINTNQLTRTADGFQAGNFIEEIIYEDMEHLVLHRSFVANNTFMTVIRQIEKGGQQRFTYALLHAPNVMDYMIVQGTCTVVE